MNVAETLRERVQTSLSPEWLELDNESDQHSGPPGRESHFRLVVVSDAFEGLSRVRRHQQIYALFADLMPSPIHALALHTFTPGEWQQRGGQAADSPDCRGGSKADPAG